MQWEISQAISPLIISSKHKQTTRSDCLLMLMLSLTELPG